jgi:maltooligosyltrehalose trehalohydrolase
LATGARLASPLAAFGLRDWRKEPGWPNLADFAFKEQPVIDDPELPKVGVTLIDATRAAWCVWAPRAERVELILFEGPEPAAAIPMEPIGRGYHRCETNAPDPGQRYAYRLDGEGPFADPCSRWQPDGVSAPSAVWLPERFAWDEAGWVGIDRADLVFYEIHVGTFTPEGTFDAIIPRIDALRDLGITAIELMPVGQFPGTRGWGYDGVHPFAPQNSYGGPEALQRLVQTCHRRKMAIFLDVVYNHFGPEGNVFPRFGDYLTDRYKTGWGSALNFDAHDSDSVRTMVIDNARQWIRDYRFDGLRLDATDQIYDRGPRHILSEIAEAAHIEASRLGRIVHVFAETDLNDAPRYLRPREYGGYGLDGHWNDDFHHAVHVTLTGENNGYYVDFRPGPQAVAKAYERVFVNDGCYSPFRRRRHGTDPTEFSNDRFVAFTQNHDQVGNRMKADRYAATLPASALRLLAGILVLAPRLPLLFMGEEYGETRPFPFFCDFHDLELVESVRRGRKAEFAHFGWDEEPPDPFAASTRDSAVLSWSWDDPMRMGLRRLYQDLFRLRRERPALRDPSHPKTQLHGPAGAEDVLEVLRGAGNQPLRFLFNLGGERRESPGELQTVRPVFRSETTDYGGSIAGDSAWDGYLAPHEFAIFEAP